MDWWGIAALPAKGFGFTTMGWTRLMRLRDPLHRTSRRPHGRELCIPQFIALGRWATRRSRRCKLHTPLRTVPCTV